MTRRASLSVLALTITGLALAGAPGAAQQPAPTLLGHVVMERQTCCGGAVVQPNRECAFSSAWPGELTIRAGRQNRGRVVARVRSGPDGAFHATLPPGTYCIVGPDKSAGNGGPAVAATASTDAECMERYRSTCDKIVIVPTDRALVRLRQSCFGPCYHGPMPP